MRRPAALALALAVLGATAAVLPAPADAAPRLRASLQRCAPGVAELRGAMPAVPGTQRMAMRFELQAQEPESGVWSTLEAPGFGTWVRSLPRRAGFVYVKRVDGLTGPRRYRAVVRFRWTGEDGAALRTARRTTPACEQDDTRPDLAPGALTALAGPDAGTLRYRLEVRNEGATPAGPSTVALDVGGEVRAPLGPLPVGRVTVVELVAPACSGVVGVRLDPDGAVAESDEADGVVSRPCPSVQPPEAPGGAR
jgi:hypothetical protein